jgi:O-succinylbenzoate synthase
VIIEKITLHHLQMRLQSPFETSFGITNDRECIILVAHSGDMLGYGECVADADPGYSYETATTAWHILQRICNQELPRSGDIQWQKRV